MPHTIVLDLDSTCINTFPDGLTGWRHLGIESNTALRNRCYRFSLRDSGQLEWLWGITRPGLYEFLEFCFAYFDAVIVWSAGTLRYVTQIVDFIFRDLPQPYRIFVRSDCPSYHGILEKPLIQLLDSELATVCDLKHTFILDDRLTVFSRTNPDNALHIPVYEPEMTLHDILAPDDCLPKLMQWLQCPEVVSAADIRQLNKSNIWN